MPVSALDMQDKLAECAFLLFSERGIDRVTVDDIAAAAGVTKGSVYWHYRSKTELIHAACRHYYRGWHAQMEQELRKIPSARDRLARAIRSSVRTCLIDERNRTFTLELFTLSIHDTGIRKSWRNFFDQVKVFYISLLEEAGHAGETPGTNPAAAVDLMLAAMEGYKLRALFEPDLCARGAERRISRELLHLVGFAR